MGPLEGVFNEAWGLYKAHWRHFFVLAIVVYAALLALNVLLVLTLGRFGAFVSAFVYLAGAFWLQGAIVKAVEDVRDGRADLSVRQTLESVRPRFNRIAVAGLLAAFGITIGLILLVVPGLVLLTWWILLIPAIVLEDRGVTEAFGRSRELVSGNGWSVFGTIILTVALFIGIGIVLGLLLFPLEDWLGDLIGDVISNTIFAPFAVLTWTLMYYRLRALKEPAPAVAAAAGS
ncbi:MAG: glycerophosphoryl diester phosphodiesterase membrane domain-containing protein [Gaiellaceae bacterium]